jgi:transposase
MSLENELFQRILEIALPWYVEAVDTAPGSREVHVYLVHEDTAKWVCAQCGDPCTLYDHQNERQWRDLELLRKRTILHAEPPRVKCGVHGVRVAALPWARPLSRFTTRLEAFVTELLKRTDARAVASLLDLSSEEVSSII